MGVSIWSTVHLHSMGGWALSGADAQAPWHGVLEIVWLQGYSEVFRLGAEGQDSVAFGGAKKFGEPKCMVLGE